MLNFVLSAVMLMACFQIFAVGAMAASQVRDSDDPLAGKPPFRRLFLDAATVEESSQLNRVFYAAEKYRDNPVISKTLPWEGWGPYVYGTVMWDDGKLKMWYQGIGKDSAEVSYAESQDGINWVKPKLGIIEYNGSKDNNIVGMGRVCHVPSVIKIPNPTSPDKQWAIYGYSYTQGASVAFSSDGLNWNWERKPEEQKLFDTSDVINFFYDTYNKRYVATYKIANRRHRAVGIVFSEDGVKWAKPIECAVFGADDYDPDATQVYGMPVFPYQGGYIGLPWMYHARWIKYGKYSSSNVMHEAQAGSARTVDVQMAWSWDLVSWNRTADRKPFIELGPEGAFDSKMIYTARAPVIVGDELYFYYGGFSNIHDDNDNAMGYIGLAKLRLDGFCSMRADNDEGWLISRREVFNTPKVTVNAKCAADGYITAELVDRNDKVIPGFSKADCVPFRGDSVRGEITWKTKDFSKEWIDKDKKIKFYIRNADLYSYLPDNINQEIDNGWHDN